MTCKICCHDRRDEIENMISLPEYSDRDIERKFKGHFSRNVVGNHRKICMLTVGDKRTDDAREEAVKKQVDHYQGMTLIPTKWSRLEREYEQMLKEATEGPDFNDAVLQAVDHLTNGSKDDAMKILDMISKRLAGDRKDRRETLKEMRSLYDNQIQAMARLEELKGEERNREPMKITYELVEAK